MSPGNTPQNFAIAEQIRNDLPELNRILQLRRQQIQDCQDMGMKRKIEAYIASLKIATDQIADILDYVIE